MNIEERIRQARTEFDLTQQAHQESVRQLADEFLAYTSEEIAALTPLNSTPLEARMAALLAESRRWVLAHGNDKPLNIGVVFAMWGEHNRLLPKHHENNPNGEDSLATKLTQLQWALAGSNIEWTVYAVDDGCPHGSADFAEGIADAHPLGNHVKVLRLADELPTTDGPLADLASADDSRKGGAIILGAMHAIEDGADAVIYTDADNSVHLGQVGLLLKPFTEGGAKVVLGNRKHPDAVLVKEGARWGIGIKILRHMQRMAGHAIFSRGILDTQAAFKLYESKLLRDIIAAPTVFDFSFDTDWILAALKSEQHITQVPFAFIDSAAESASIAQGPMTTWETLLLGLVKAVKHHGYAEGDAADMIRVIDAEIKDYQDLERIIDLLPPELEAAGETEYGNPAVMSPDALQRWLQNVKQSAQ